MINSNPGFARTQYLQEVMQYNVTHNFPNHPTAGTAFPGVSPPQPETSFSPSRFGSHLNLVLLGPKCGSSTGRKSFLFSMFQKKCPCLFTLRTELFIIAPGLEYHFNPKEKKGVFTCITQNNLQSREDTLLYHGQRLSLVLKKVQILFPHPYFSV